MSSIGRFVAWLFTLSSASAWADSCVWYAADDALHQVRTSSNQVTLSVPLKRPDRLVMGATDCAVWTIDKLDRRLLRYGTDGAAELDLQVQDLDAELASIEQLHLDPYDGSVWIADGRRVVRVSTTGQRLAGTQAPGEVRRIQIALDRSVWILGKRELWHVDAQAELLGSYPLAPYLAADAKHFAVDSLRGVAWIADEHRLIQLKFGGASDPPLTLQLTHPIASLALDPIAGAIWVTQKEALLAFSATGSLAYTVNLEALDLRKPETLAFDPVSRSLWAGTERTVARFTDSGQFVHRFVARDADNALGAPAFKVEPMLQLVRPPANALTNNPFLSFTLSYGAHCNGEPCPFAGSHASSYQLSATLNGESVEPQFVFDANAQQASFTPASRLPEGSNSFSAKVKDRFGNSSNAIAISFAVDTTAPRYLALSPANGSVLQSPQVVIQGSVDDEAASVVFENFAAFGGIGPNPQGKAFAFPITLNSGVNTIKLTAIDSAGNAASAILQLTLAAVGVTIDSPASGSSTNSDIALITGTFQGPPRTAIAVNGVLAALSGDRFYAQVGLQLGGNLVTATATSPDGTSATQSINVTSTGVAPISISPSTTNAIAPVNIIFDLGNATGRAIKRIEADYDGNGTFNLVTTNPNAVLQFTYATPGIYTALFRVTDDLNVVHTYSMVLNIEDRNQVDQQLRSVWSSFTQALVAQDKAAAMNSITVSSRDAYGPIYDALMLEMPAIIGSFSALQSSILSSTVGEYAVNRTIDGVDRIFFIYFLRDVDGVWRIDSM